MKQNYTITAAVLLVLSSACRLYGQTVTLGDTSFDATSDQITANWYQPLVPGTSITFEGFGASAGQTKTETYSVGDSVAGVKAVKRHIEGTAAAVAVEDWWIARDANDDLRVLKLVRAGAVVFEASPTTAAPMYMPGTLAEGTTWELFGETSTVEWTAPSHSGGIVKVKRTAGANVTRQSYRSAQGLTYEANGPESEPSSGWRSKVPTSTPSAPTP